MYDYTCKKINNLLHFSLTKEILPTKIKRTSDKLCTFPLQIKATGTTFLSGTFYEFRSTLSSLFNQFNALLAHCSTSSMHYHFTVQSVHCTTNSLFHIIRIVSVIKLSGFHIFIICFCHMSIFHITIWCWVISLTCL